MEIFQRNDFKMARNRVEQICENYRIAETKLKHLNNTILNEKIDTQTINKYRNYVNTIELILQCLNKEDAAMIRNVNLRRIPTRQLGYSKTTYYTRYRKAAESFLKYLS
jgi:hypothetical protein